MVYRGGKKFREVLRKEGLDFASFFPFLTFLGEERTGGAGVGRAVLKNETSPEPDCHNCSISDATSLCRLIA